MGRCGAIYRPARYKHTLYHHLQFHSFQAQDGQNTSQETQTRPPHEPGGKGGAYGANQKGVCLLHRTTANGPATGYAAHA